MFDGEFLEMIRTERNLNQVEFAKLLGLKSQQAYQAYIRKKVISPRKALQFQKALKIKSFNHRSYQNITEKKVEVLLEEFIKLKAIVSKRPVKEIKEEILASIDLL